MAELRDHGIKVTQEDESRELDFYARLADEHWFRSARVFTVSSRAEVGQTVQDYDMDETDTDVMTYSTVHYAFHPTQSVPHSYNGIMIMIYPSPHQHPGYVILVR